MEGVCGFASGGSGGEEVRNVAVLELAGLGRKPFSFRGEVEFFRASSRLLAKTQIFAVE